MAEERAVYCTNLTACSGSQATLAGSVVLMTATKLFRLLEHLYWKH